VTQSDPPKSGPNAPKTKKPVRWRRRLIIALSVFVALILALRAAVSLLLPPVLNKVAGHYKLRCAYDRLDLNVLSGAAELWGLEIGPVEGGQPILQSDYCQGEISIYNLLKGRLVVYRAVADGVDLNVERTADGRIPVLARFATAGASPPPPQAPSTPATNAIDLQPPLRIDALRLSHIRARFHDQFIIPELDSHMVLDMRLTNLGVPHQPTLFEMDFSSDPVLDSLEIEGNCSSDSNNVLTGHLGIIMRGLHPKPAEGYLRQFGLHAVADNISASMSGELTARAAPNPADGIQATLLLQQAHLKADGQEAAAMDRLQLNADGLNAKLAALSSLQIQGVRLQALRSSDGALGACGLELTTPSAVGAPNPQPLTIAPVAAAQAAYRFKLAQFLLTNVHASFHDDSVRPPVSLALDLNRLAARNVDSSPGQSDPTMEFAVALSSPGMVRAISASGELRPFAGHKSFTLTAQADGIAPTAIKPYLDAAGLESEWKDGTFTCAAEGLLSSDSKGNPTAAAKFKDIVLSDGQRFLSLDAVGVSGVGFDPQTGLIHASAVNVSGPELFISRDSSGQLHAFGFATKTPTASPPASGTEPAAPSAAPTNRMPPRIAIDQFTWKGIHLSLLDDSVTPAARLEMSDAGVELSDLMIDVDSLSPPTKPGRIHAWLASPQLARRISADGTILTGNHQAKVTLDFSGQGIRGDAIAAYLKPIGIEPILKNASLQCHTVLTANDSNGMTISLACENLKYTDGNQALASLGALGVKNMRILPSGMSIDAVEIDSPHAVVSRNAGGALEAAGVRLIVPAAEPSATAAQSVSAPSIGPTSQPSLAASLKSFKINDASVEWIDRATPKPVDTTARLSVEAQDLAYAPDAKPAKLHVAASVDGSVESLTADGVVTTAGNHQSVQLDIAGQGIRAGAMAQYLPPGIRCTLGDGRLHAGFQAAAADNSRGGRSAEIQVADFDYRDRADGPSLFSFDSFHVKASRLDPAAKVIAIDDITLKGMKTDATKTSNGLDLLGIELGSASPQANPGPLPTATTQPGMPRSPSGDLLTQIAARRNKYPWITVNSVDLNVSRIGFTDQTRPRAAPLAISNLRLHNIGAIGWLGKDLESNPPTQLELTGTINPIVDSFTLAARATPFSRQKTFGIDLAASGIHGKGLTDLVPELQPKIDGAGLTAGQFHAALDGTLKLETVDPASFDLSRGGKLEFTAKDVNFRADPVQPVLAGVGEIHSEGIAIAPNAKGVEVHQLEIENITGSASLATDGLHALGLLIKMPSAPAHSPAVQQAAIEDIADPPSSAAPASVAAAPLPPEYKIDKLAISGMNFRFEDRTCDPPLVVPINGLDFEAQDLSNLAEFQDKSIRFSAMLNSAKTPLPSTNTGETDQDRELFSQIAASGVISLYPNTKGWAKASVSGFELISLHALADQEKVKLGGGTFDGDVDVRFIEDGTIDTSTRLVLTDLSLSEPPDGPISRTLKLPAPLDVVIAALQDQDGSITVPLNVPLKNSTVNSVSIAAAAGGALADVIATAIASTPLKVTGLLGLTGKSGDQEQPAVIQFLPGYAGLDVDQRRQLDALAAKLRKKHSLDATVKHEMGGEDIQLAASRVNPSPDDALALAGQFQRQKQALLFSRAQAAGEVRATLASGSRRDAAAAIARLRDIDRQLADTENAMDRAYELLRPGADRQALRRTRSACLLIARTRLEAIRAILTAGGDKSLADRVHVANPQFASTEGLDQSKVTIIVVKKK
jgi:hypothetical protein